MTVRFADNHGNEVVVKESYNLAKYQFDEGFVGREGVLEGLRALARVHGLPLVDMDEIRREFRQLVTDAGDLPADGEHSLTVTDQRSGEPFEIVVDVDGVRLDGRDLDDLHADFFIEEMPEEVIRDD